MRGHTLTIIWISLGHFWTVPALVRLLYALTHDTPCATLIMGEKPSPALEKKFLKAGVLTIDSRFKQAQQCRHFNTFAIWLILLFLKFALLKLWIYLGPKA